MSKRIFTQEQVNDLRQNPNVANCSERSILYHKNFKVLAIDKYHQGISPSWIFKDAGFNLTIIGHSTPEECLKRWRRIFRKKGKAGLTADGRKGNNPHGRPKGIKHLPDKEKIKYLETQIAYLKAENSFLTKLRKKS
jgi:transposase